MKELVDRVMFIHVSLPGQHPADEDLHTFPSMQEVAINLVTVLDMLGITDRGVVVMGEGAGANIAARFAMYYPNRVRGVVLLNFHSANKRDDIDKKKQNYQGNWELNMNNVKLYEDSFEARGDITMTPLSKRTLVVLGAKSICADESQDILNDMKKDLCSMIRISEVENVVEEAPEQTADAILLFFQALGLVPQIQRRVREIMEEKRKVL